MRDHPTNCLCLFFVGLYASCIAGCFAHGYLDLLDLGFTGCVIMFALLATVAVLSVVFMFVKPRDHGVCWACGKEAFVKWFRLGMGLKSICRKCEKEIKLK